VAGTAGGANGAGGDDGLIIERVPVERPDHRVAAIDCERERPRNRIYFFVGGSPGSVVCQSHDDCSDGVNGRCQAFGYECTYDACFTDRDCAAGELCDCAGGLHGSHRCLPATDCRVDADCPSGRFCSPSGSRTCVNLNGVVGYFCHTPADDCGADCPLACVFDADIGHWRCTDSFCTTP
jgi:hypothetical protein